MAVDYPSLKVPDLKKLLQERGLMVSGNKAELISRLVENDKKSSIGAAGEDEIDWDEDDKPITALANAPETVAATSRTKEISEPLAAPTEIVDTDPKPAAEIKVIKSEEAPKSTEVANKVAIAQEDSTLEAPKQEYSIGLVQSDAQKEAEKRAARAKRFGIKEDEESKKMAERAKKFGLNIKDNVVQGLDAALPERRPKRVRDDQYPGERSVSSKRQTNSRRPDQNSRAAMNRKAITNDPVERAKAEARAKRFAKCATT